MYALHSRYGRSNTDFSSQSHSGTQYTRASFSARQCPGSTYARTTTTLLQPSCVFWMPSTRASVRGRGWKMSPCQKCACKCATVRLSLRLGLRLSHASQPARFKRTELPNYRRHLRCVVLRAATANSCQIQHLEHVCAAAAVAGPFAAPTSAYPVSKATEPTWLSGASQPVSAASVSCLSSEVSRNPHCLRGAQCQQCTCRLGIYLVSPSTDSVLAATSTAGHRSAWHVVLQGCTLCNVQHF